MAVTEAEINEKIKDLADAITNIRNPSIKPYSVSVDSHGYSADWNDIFIVVAESGADAKEQATTYIADHFPNREIDGAEAYLLTGPSRVVGRLIDTSEE